MISEHNMAGLVGAYVTDLEGARIGAIDEILVDPATGRPGWARVRMGLLGRTRFVPLDEADESEGRVRVPYTKERVRRAPRVGGTALTAEGEEQLITHYRSALGGDEGAVRPR